ncbi:MAG: T9SS type A sorting domain-containing protein [Bacteroidota bacterium]
MEIRVLERKILFFLCCLLMGFSLEAQQRDGDDPQSNGGDANDAIVMDFEEGGPGGDPCKRRIRVTLDVANLDSNPEEGTIYNLPTGVFDLYLSYDLDGVTGRQKFEDFTYLGMTRNGVYIFRSIVTIDFDVLSYCQSSASNDSRINYTYDLETAAGNPYPVDSHTDVGDIFTCEAFTFPTCTTRKGSNDDNTHYTGSLIQGCSTCLNSHQTPTGKGDERASDQEQKNLRILASPNPFTSELTLLLPENRDSELELRIFDASGKQLHAAQLGTDANSTYYLQTEHWSEGIYFCQLQMGHTAKIFKLVKI